MQVHNLQLTNFVSTLFWVYNAMILAWVIVGMLNLPYNRVLAAIRDFLDQTVAPFVNLFRRFIPPLGPLDLSPLFAFIALQVVRQVLLRGFGI